MSEVIVLNFVNLFRPSGERWDKIYDVRRMKVTAKEEEESGPTMTRSKSVRGLKQFYSNVM